MARPSDIRIQKRLLDAEEAGDYMSASAWTIRKMIRDGELPFVPRGRKKLVDVRDLDLFIDREKTTHVV